MINIQIDNLRLTLHGVSANVAEAAVEGLHAELQRRLGRMRIGKAHMSGAAPVDIVELSMSTLHEQAALDAGVLRGMIADQLLRIIDAQLPSDPEGGQT